MRMKRTSTVCGAAAICLAVNVHADKHEVRGHDAHEHGHGTLALVVEGEELVIELRVPGVNVVGFEHEPSTDAQRQAVSDALAVFSRAEELFEPSPGAECEVEEVEVALGEVEHHEGEHDDHDDRHGDDHKHSHGHDEDKQAGEEHHEHEEEAHNELHAEYHFHCHEPGKLEKVTVRVFEHLRDAEELEAQVVTPSLQAAVELEPGDTVISLAR